MLLSSSSHTEHFRSILALVWEGQIQGPWWDWGYITETAISKDKWVHLQESPDPTDPHLRELYIFQR